ncbi:MAG TPA: alpha-L-rhamnosidase [Terriglobia bacterium]|nr:alpha-L-rhamnosidase [Terriglobia bacterium]
MHRRAFLEAAAAAGACGILSRSIRAAETPASRIAFETTDAAYSRTYAAALDVLQRNTMLVSGYSEPVLIEGSNYSGVWMECGPQEGLVYADIRPDIARNNHLAFFALQKEDGQIPCWSRTTATGFGQIQMVVPIAATAWELARRSGDQELLEKTYAGASRWDAWLRRYRNTRGTGLCEGFCTWDTGHDNSPRWKGMPNRCPDADARNLPPEPSLPRLSPDLSATVYGGRVALAAIARALGKNSEADRWLDDAEAIRSAILKKLYVSSDAAFYDLDAQNRFVRIRSDVISRVLGEHVVDQKLFNTIYEKQIHNPRAFWAAYPLPSIALDDPAFVRPITGNSWGGPSQALTALRAPRWMEHYGKAADLAYLMKQWTSAIVRAGAFLQQMDPLDGAFTSDKGDYSPAALVFMDFTWRLSGVRHMGDTLEWNLNPGAARSRFRLQVSPTRTAEVRYSGAGDAQVFVNDRMLYQTRETVRLVTDLEGNLQSVTGIADTKTNVALGLPSGGSRRFSIQPNASQAMRIEAR